ncbi:anthranilate synthase component I family protein [bacterium]|nr:anthranilate synthase component I family protein [bacterium]
MSTLHSHDNRAVGAGQVPACSLIELPADLDTPVSAYMKLCGADGGFLLESSEHGRGLGRYSFIGLPPFDRVEIRGREMRISTSTGEEVHQLDPADPLAPLRRFIEQSSRSLPAGLPPMLGGAVGSFGYDCVRLFERIPDSNANENGLADANFLVPRSVVEFDHLTRRMRIAVMPCAADATQAEVDARARHYRAVLRGPLPVEEEQPYALSSPAQECGYAAGQYIQAVEQAKEHIAAGDIFQVVLSRRQSGHTPASALSIYRALRSVNPSPYMFLLDFGGFQLVGSSPEELVSLDEGVARVMPIAGTRPLAADEEGNLALEQELLADPKERSEHLMLVDLGRNDLGRVCEYGSVNVDELMEVRRYSHVMHLVSRVSGRLAKEQDCFKLLASAFPAGTLSGAPKIRAMELIDELEPFRRGAYGGAVGYIGRDCRMDMCIAIRMVHLQQGRYTVQAGAGIVADSVPQKEYEECSAKMAALLEAIRIAEEGIG